jgi:hypothetical protein
MIPVKTVPSSGQLLEIRPFLTAKEVGDPLLDQFFAGLCPPINGLVESFEFLFESLNFQQPSLLADLKVPVHDLLDLPANLGSLLGRRVTVLQGEGSRLPIQVGIRIRQLVHLGIRGFQRFRFAVGPTTGSGRSERSPLAMTKSVRRRLRPAIGAYRGRGRFAVGIVIRGRFRLTGAVWRRRLAVFRAIVGGWA